ncbi:MAG: Uma2 family endonuclease [Caldilineaceae bacterium]
MSVVAHYAGPEQIQKPVDKKSIPLSTSDDLTTELIDNGEQENAEETVGMGSYNHAMTQTNLGFLLKRLGGYSVFTELSLDTSGVALDNVPKRDETRPDVCLYPKRSLSRPFDILKMSEMPLLTVEILSPRQGIQEILEKFAVYFACGVQSCWLVDPITAIVAVYSSLDERTVFSTGEVVDKKLGIHLPFSEIFE